MAAGMWPQVLLALRLFKQPEQGQQHHSWSWWVLDGAAAVLGCSSFQWVAWWFGVLCCAERSVGAGLLPSVTRQLHTAIVQGMHYSRRYGPG